MQLFKIRLEWIKQLKVAINKDINKDKRLIRMGSGA